MSSNNMTTGVKGSDCYGGSGSKVLDLYTMLNRGLNGATVDAYIRDIFVSGSEEDQIDAFVLAFQTRDIRGGKGERDLFYHMFQSLFVQNKVAALSVLELIPEYGYWEDINKLARNGSLTGACIDLTVKQFLKDESQLASGKDGLSLVARHMPREHNKKPEDRALAKKLAYALCPGDKKALASYRKRLSAVTKALDVPALHFSSKTWSSLDPATMPGRCLKVHIKALLNKPVSGKHGRRVASLDPDRVFCATKFSMHMAKAAKGLATVKGANVVFPHELVSKVLAHLQFPPTIRKFVYDEPPSHGKMYHNRKTSGYDSDVYSDYDDDESYRTGKYIEVPNPARLSSEELDSIEAQWRSIVDPIKALGTLGKWLAMCDFSGSMGGDPMNVSMALGLIIAECNTGIFKNSILTFDSKPTLHRFSTEGLVSRVNEVRGLAQGTSTNFQAAYNLVLKELIDAGVPAGQEPTELVVLTDMGFDAACGIGYGHKTAVKTKEHETHFQIARRAFEKQGIALLGDGMGWTAPRIVCWNLRAEYKDFQAHAHETGVLQVSGWSPSMLKVLTTRGLEAFTPLAMLHAVLSDPRYDAVRERVMYSEMPPLV